MRIVFTTGGAYIPEIFGGAECSIDQLVGELATRGHASEVVTGVRGRYGRVRHIVSRFAALGSSAGLPDQRNGYETWRVPPAYLPAALRERLRAFRPDLLVAWNQGCEEAAALAMEASVPAMIWVPDVGFEWHRSQLPAGPCVVLAGASQFVADRIRERLGRQARVLRPLIRFEAYRATDAAPEHMTLVNPREHKGLEVALAVAALLPRRKLLLVDSWQISPEERAALARRIAPLPNVALQPWVSDMRTVYGRTSVLLVPSQCEDAAPRVILEAQSSGVPAVGSQIGGIPEVLGDGGAIVPAGAPPERWVEAVENVLSRREELALLARSNAARSDFGSEAITEQFLSIAGDLVAAARPAAVAARPLAPIAS